MIAKICIVKLKYIFVTDPNPGGKFCTDPTGSVLIYFLVSILTFGDVPSVCLSF